MNATGNRRPETRSRARRQLALEPLEGRMVLSSASPVPFMGPVPPVAHAAVDLHASASKPFVSSIPQVTQTTVQTGTTLGLPWRAYYGAQIKRYRLDIQDHAAFGQVSVQDDGGQIFFRSGLTGSPVEAVDFPSTNVAVRTFANNMSNLFGGDMAVTPYLQNAALTTFSVTPRTTTSQINVDNGTNNAGTGEVKVTYDYNCITNTGTLTINDILSGLDYNDAPTYTYSKSRVDASVGDPLSDSPTANPVDSIDFSDGQQTAGGINVFEAGEADATITVRIVKPSNDTFTNTSYKFAPGAGF